MNDNWKEIVEQLHPYFEKSTAEKDYQSKIEECFRILGWKTSNNTMIPQKELPIGNNKKIKPDIVLHKLKDNTPIAVLPIEIKRPDNVQTARQADQLGSYMRQLKLNVGLYIGENIQLYYDVPNSKENAIIPIFSTEIDDSDENGAILCDLLLYSDFSLDKLKSFCTEQYQKLQSRNNLHKRLLDFFAENNAIKNTLSALKDIFIKDGFDESAIDAEFKAIEISIKFNAESATTQNPHKQNGTETTKRQDRSKYSFDGLNFFTKREFVIKFIRKYISDNPGITFSELEKQFPPELHSKSLGVVRKLSDIKNRIATDQPDWKKRYSLKEKDIITLDDGTQLVANNQWGSNTFPKFLKQVEKQCHVTNSEGYIPTIPSCGNEIDATSNKKLITRLQIKFNDGFTISEKDAAASFRKFIEYIGISKVESLKLTGRKDILLISNTLYPQYSKHQRLLSNGYYLFSNYSTVSLRQIILNIASLLDLKLSVDIIAK